jgi:hypothetical protein
MRHAFRLFVLLLGLEVGAGIRAAARVMRMAPTDVLDDVDWPRHSGGGQSTAVLHLG